MKQLIKNAGLPPDVEALCLGAANAMDDIFALLDFAESTERMTAPQLVNAREQFNFVLEDLDSPMRSGDEALKWALRVLDMVEFVLDRWSDIARIAPEGVLRDPDEFLTYVPALRRRIEGERDLRALMLRYETELGKVSKASKRMEQTQANLERTTAEAGRALLSEHFTTYAEDELKSAKTFRMWSIVMVGVAIAGAAVILLVPALRVDPNDWTAFAGKFALLGGIGTLAAYFARQATVHRRSGMWAKSLEIQLKSLPAFIEAVPPEGRAAAFLTLSQRVLGAPPNKDGDLVQDQGMPVMHLVDLVSAALKKS